MTAQLEGKGKPGSLGTLIVRADAQAVSNVFCTYRIQGLNLPNVTSACCGLSTQIEDVRYEWHRASTQSLNNFQKVFSSEFVRNTQSPHWPQEKKNIALLCNADESVPIRIVVLTANLQLGYI